MGYCFYCIRNVNDADLSDDPSGNPFNVYMLIYRIRIKSGDSSRAIYAGGSYSNIKKNDEGELKHEAAITGEPYYQTIDDLRKDLTDAGLDERYTCEDHLSIF